VNSFLLRGREFLTILQFYNSTILLFGNFHQPVQSEEIT
jgi:hypothetical protein